MPHEAEPPKALMGTCTCTRVQACTCRPACRTRLSLPKPPLPIIPRLSSERGRPGRPPAGGYRVQGGSVGGARRRLRGDGGVCCRGVGDGGSRASPTGLGRGCTLLQPREACATSCSPWMVVGVGSTSGVASRGSLQSGVASRGSLQSGVASPPWPVPSSEEGEGAGYRVQGEGP